MVTVRSPPAISPGSALKLPESARTRWSRVWLTVWDDPNTTPLLIGQTLTSVPSPSQCTTWSCVLPSALNDCFTVQRHWRSGSTTGCAVEK